MTYFFHLSIDTPAKGQTDASAYGKKCCFFLGLTLAWGLLFLLPVPVSAQCVVTFTNCPTQVTLLDADHSGNEILHWPSILANPTGSCTDFSLIQSGGLPPGSLVALGNYNISYTAQVLNLGNQTTATATCNFEVSVVPDEEPPVFRYWPPAIYTNVVDSSGDCTAVVLWPLPITTDNSGTVFSVVSNINCGSVFPPGITTVVYTATDASQNTATVSFTVTVSCEVNATEAGTLSHLHLSPNPNAGTFSVELPQPAVSGMVFRITNLTGQSLWEKPAEPGIERQSLTTGALPPGLYFLQMLSAGKLVAVEKFVKQ